MTQQMNNNQWIYSCLFLTSSISSLSMRKPPRWCNGEEYACQCRRLKRCGFDPWVRKIPRRRAWQSTPVFLPGESHGQRSVGGYSSWDGEEPDTTKQLNNNITDSMDMSLGKAPRDGEGQGSLACCTPWGRRGLDAT